MNRHASCLVVGLGMLTALFIAGCAHDNPPPKTEPPSVVTQSAPPQARNNKSDQVINLSADIRKACDIDDSDRAPKFDFDSTNLSSNDRDVLQKVSTCLTTGPLKGRAIRLTGRADPRGEPEYNMNLGESRASAVKRYMHGLGVSDAKMGDTSRGALDATGHDEETWRRDRRVDVTLAD
jgi:peptidoglycan-associated lipoprotein